MPQYAPTTDDPLGQFDPALTSGIRKYATQLREECDQRMAAMEVRLAQSKSVHAGLLAKEMNRSAHRLTLLRELWDAICEEHDPTKVPISRDLEEKVLKEIHC